MINNIEEYLSRLRQELSGSDRATVQDALSDAEEYLRTALGSAVETSPSVVPGEALADIISRYGSPGEVAAAYKEIESRTPPAFTRPAYKEIQPVTPTPATPVIVDRRPFYAQFFGIFAEPKAWGALLYLIFSLGTGIIYFTWVVTGLSVSGGLLVLIIGLPLAALFLLSVRGIALVEGRIVEALLGVRMPRRPLFSRTDIGWWQKIKGMIFARHTWTAMVYMVLQLPLGILYFTVVISLVSASIWLIGRPVWELAFDFPAFIVPPYGYYTAAWAMPLVVIGGILLITATMHLVRITGKGHGMFAKVMLVKE